MTHEYLLSGKFISPQLPAICAPRERLIEMFFDASEKRIALVCAPPGYGKSVSMRLWLDHATSEHIWIGLDSYDNTPSVFYKLLGRCLLAFQPENKAMSDILSNPSFSSAPVEAAVSLISEFHPDDSKRVIVIDDIHVIDNPDIRKSLSLVLKRLPMRFTVFLLSRNIPEHEAETLAPGGSTATISTESLLFSAGEIRAYLGAHGRPVTRAESETILSSTGGWPIAVNAIAMSERQEITLNRKILLENYIEEQVWNKWDEGLRDFLMETSLLDEMDAVLCNSLTGRDDSLAVLEELHRTNVFINRMSDGKYRLHSLFLHFIRDRAARIGLPTQESHRLVANWHINSGNLLKGWHHAMLACDAETILLAAYHFKRNSIHSLEEYTDFYEVFNRYVPESVIREYPMLYPTHIWLCYLKGKADDMARYLDSLYPLLPLLADRFPQFYENTLLVASLDSRPKFADQIEMFAGLPPFTHVHDEPQGTTISHRMPFLHRSNRDYCELTDSGLIDRMSPIFGVLLKRNYPTFMRYLSAGLLLEQNRLKEAAEAVGPETSSGLLDKVLSTVSEEVSFAVVIFQAALGHAMGDSNRVRSQLARLEDFIESSGAHYLYRNFAAFRQKLRLLDGDEAAAREWLAEYFVNESEDFELYKIFQYFTTARAHIVQGDLQAAEKCIGKLLKLSEDFNRPQDTAEAYVLRSIVEWASKKTTEAVESLECAIEIMQQYDFVRLAADEGRAVLPILKALQRRAKRENCERTTDPRHLSVIVLAAHKQAGLYKGITARLRTEPPKLSKRQRRVLELLSQGLKNAEIAAEMGLTVHTIKSHTNAAYRKLDVNSATEAVLRANELNLLK